MIKADAYNPKKSSKHCRNPVFAATKRELMSTQHELISVIIPVYNVKEFLCECVDSVISQTYKELEIWLIDDGSTDGSGKICDEYSKKDSRIHVIHKENGGVSSARNAGIDNVTSDYFVFVDSDDYIMPTMIEELWNLKHDNDVCISQCEFVDLKGGKFIKKHVGPEQITLFYENDLINKFYEYYRYFSINYNKLFPKEIFENLRYPEGKCFEDAYVIHHLLLNTKSLAHTNKQLYVYRRRKDSITNTMNLRKSMDLIEVLIDRIDLFSKNGHDKMSARTYYRMLFYVKYVKKKSKHYPDYNEEYKNFKSIETRIKKYEHYRKKASFKIKFDSWIESVIMRLYYIKEALLDKYRMRNE